MVNIPLLILSSVMMLVGLFGIFIPLIPGVPIVWLGFFIYAIGTGFRTISIPAVVILFVLTALTLVLDWVMPLLGLKKYKASNWSLLGSILGGIIGLIFFQIWGLILGPIVGAFLGELIARGELKLGLRAALATLVSTVISNLIKVALALIMIGYFIWSFFR
jgi:uncharacterized protein